MNDPQTTPDAPQADPAPALADVIGPPPPNVNMHLDADIDAGIVRMAFNQPVTNVSLRPGACRDLAKVLREMANQVDQAVRLADGPPRAFRQRARGRRR